MAQLFSLQFASDLSDFNSEIDTHGDLIWNGSAGASPDGSTGCAQCIIDDQTAAAGIKDHTAFTSQTHMRCAFYVDVGDMALATNDQSFQLWSWRSSLAGYLFLSIIRLSGVVNIRHSMTLDSSAGTVTADTAFTTLPDWIEVWATKATNGTGANDGISRVYFGGGGYAANGELISALTLSGRDFFDAFTLTDEFRIGATNVGTGITASGILLDNMVARDDATPIFFVDNASPTVSDPGAMKTGIGFSKPIGTLVTVADTDSNLSTIRYQCTEAKGDITVTLSGAATISSGTNGTHDLTVSGTNAELLTVHATAVYVATTTGDSTVTITATDSLAAQGSQAFTVTGKVLYVYADNQTDLNATLATLQFRNGVVESSTVVMGCLADDTLTGSAQTIVTTELEVPGAPSGGSGAGGAALAAVQQRKRIIRGRRTRERRFP